MPFQFRKEAIEEDLNSNFPSQGQGNPPLYYSLSEVVVPTYSINQSAEGSSLPEFLQQAWDFSTGNAQINNTTTTLVNNTGFWRISVKVTQAGNSGTSQDARIQLTDGLTTKTVWRIDLQASGSSSVSVVDDIIVFVRSGDSVTGTSSNGDTFLDVSYRQIATVNGTLVDPLGYSAA